MIQPLVMQRRPKNPMVPAWSIASGVSNLDQDVRKARPFNLQSDQVHIPTYQHLAATASLMPRQMAMVLLDNLDDLSATQVPVACVLKCS